MHQLSLQICFCFIAHRLLHHHLLGCQDVWQSDRSTSRPQNYLTSGGRGWGPAVPTARAAVEIAALPHCLFKQNEFLAPRSLHLSPPAWWASLDFIRDVSHPPLPSRPQCWDLDLAGEVWECPTEIWSCRASARRQGKCQVECWRECQNTCQMECQNECLKRHHIEDH